MINYNDHIRYYICNLAQIILYNLIYYKIIIINNNNSTINNNKNKLYIV